LPLWPEATGAQAYTSVQGEYQLQQFRGGERIVSMTFPELAITAADIFEAAGL
jgi:Uma2 family endonuclease